MIEDNRQRVYGVIPTNTAGLIPVRNSKNEATEVYTGVYTQTTAQTIYTVPTAKIFRWHYFMLFASYLVGEHISVLIYDSTPALRGAIYDYVAQGTITESKLHSFTQFPVLNAGDYIQLGVAATINNYSFMVHGYLEDA
jgi:hypothetical protein